MLHSMTGHGQGESELQGFHVSVELRAVNNRYLKLNFRGLENHLALEAKVESVVREVMKRGSVNVGVRIRTATEAPTHQINTAAIKAYADQLKPLLGDVVGGDSLSLDAILQLPGVIEEPQTVVGEELSCWPAIEEALREALTTLQSMRETEGRSMEEDFGNNLDAIEERWKQIDQLAPTAIQNYQARLMERIGQLLEGQVATIQSSDIAREVGVFAERCDISEELVRLQSHVDQFREIMTTKAPVGKKLEFIIQEMFRETNTIGSKSNDAKISEHVIELKTRIERMREMIQNVE